jgi:hypothetical protein
MEGWGLIENASHRLESPLTALAERSGESADGSDFRVRGVR